jgi:dihydrodipicolinate synthase/N-acetylneuraminate lyase
MVRTPHYYKAQMKPENMLAFYRTVADRAPIPVIIYNFPPSTGYDIPAEVVIALAEHPNLIGIKESGGDINKVKKMVTETRHIHRTVAVTEVFEAVTGRMKAAPPAENVVPATALSRAPAAVAAPPVKTRTKDAGFQVMVGSAHLLQSMLNVGAVGAILAFADCAPTACFEIYSAWKDNDVDLAREKQERIKQAAIRVVGELGVPGLKYALDFNGYYGGPPRLPLLTASAEVRAEIERLMEYIRN